MRGVPCSMILCCISDSISKFFPAPQVFKKILEGNLHFIFARDSQYQQSIILFHSYAYHGLNPWDLLYLWNYITIN